MGETEGKGRYSLKPNERVGLFGGSFDPPTRAHLIAAEHAQRILQLDKILFVLNRVSPHKLDREVTPPAIRLQMLEAALGHSPDFCIDTSELDREGPSFTVETLRHFTSTFPETHFTLIFGMDALNSFYRWREPEEILELVEVAVMNRGKEERSENAAAWLDRVMLIEIPVMDTSSTQVREMVAAEQDIRDLVPPGVAAIIEKEMLYRSM